MHRARNESVIASGWTHHAQFTSHKFAAPNVSGLEQLLGRRDR
jgi:hypothetical protein